MSKSVFVCGSVLPLLEYKSEDFKNLKEIKTEWHIYTFTKKNNDFVDGSISFTDKWKKKYMNDIKKTLEKKTTECLSNIYSIEQNKFEIKIWSDGFIRMRTELDLDELLNLIIKDKIERISKKASKQKDLLKNLNETKLNEIKEAIKEKELKNKSKYIENIKKAAFWNFKRVYEDLKENMHNHIFSKNGVECFVFEWKDITDEELKEKINQAYGRAIKNESKDALKLHFMNVIKEFRNDCPYEYWYWTLPNFHQKIVTYISHLDSRIGALNYLNTVLKPIPASDNNVREIDKNLEVLKKGSDMLRMIENTSKFGWQFFALSFVVLVGILNIIMNALLVEKSTWLWIMGFVCAFAISGVVNNYIVREIDKIIKLEL
ncbi:MAG: hypothetical protein CVT89_04855 [Candidatus Altiarchaeales archaeon HGW-Altiarchaeales-2]|nr:MAG: hypothetical protein CVT89_04855 [Candidatus Altiarchaeales archaeon HGW-Altiarchaeales-2]